jgi:hypothetical protein
MQAAGVRMHDNKNRASLRGRKNSMEFYAATAARFICMMTFNLSPVKCGAACRWA